MSQYLNLWQVGSDLTLKAHSFSGGSYATSICFPMRNILFNAGEAGSLVGMFHFGFRLPDQCFRERLDVTHEPLHASDFGLVSSLVQGSLGSSCSLLINWRGGVALPPKLSSSVFPAFPCYGGCFCVPARRLLHPTFVYWWLKIKPSRDSEPTRLLSGSTIQHLSHLNTQ